MTSKEMLVKFSADISDMQKQMAKMGDNVSKGMKDIEKKIGTSTGNANSKLSKLGNGLKNATKKIAVGATAIVGSVGGIAVKAMETSAEMQALESQFSQTFGDLEKDASKALQKIADESGMAEGRLKGSFTKISAFAKTTGMSTEDSLAMAERAMVVAADSSAYYDRSLEDVTESLQSFLKGNYENDSALGLSCTETTRNAKANDLYGKSFKDLSEEQKQLTLLKMVEDANKASGALGQAARESDTWTNQLGNLKQNFKEFMGEMGNPILDTGVQALKGLSEVIGGIDGEKIGNAIGGTVEKIAEWIKSVDWAGAWENLKGIGGVLKDILAPAWETLKSVGEGLADIVKGVMGAFTDTDTAELDPINTALVSIKDTLTWFKDNGDIVASAVAGIATAYAGFKAKGAWDVISNSGVWKNMVTYVGKFISLAKSQGLVTAFGTALKFVGTAIKGITKSFGFWMIIGALVVAIGVLIYKNWDTICAYAKKLWEWIKDAFSKIWNKIKEVWDKVKEKTSSIWTSIKDSLSNAWTSIKNTVSNVFNGIINFFKKWGIHILMIVCLPVGLIVATIRKHWDSIKAWTTNTFNKIKEFFSTIWSTIKNIFAKVLITVVQYVRDKFNTLKTNISNIWNGIKNTASKVWGGVKDKIIAPIKKAIDWVKDKFNSLKTFFSKIGSEWGKKIKSGLKSFVNGFVDRINSAIDKVLSGFNKIIDGINWVMKKIAGEDIAQIKHINKDKYKIPQLAKGTNNWQGGTALVGEAGRELVSDPLLGTFMADKPMLLPLSKGASVLRNSKTEKLLATMGIPAFKDGKKEGWFSKLTSKIKSVVSDVWDFVKSPSKLWTKVLEKLDIGKMSGFAKNLFDSAKTAFKTKIVDKIKSLFEDNNPDTWGGLQGTYQERWNNYAKGWAETALKNMGYEKGSKSYKDFMTAMKIVGRYETGYNNSATNNWDSNAKKGTPSSGWLQFIKPTFNSYKQKGYDSWLNPVHQAMAFVNYANKKYGGALKVPGVKSILKGGKYKPYASGGIIGSPTMALMGEAGKEAVVPLSNSHALKPFGDAVANSILNQNGNQTTTDVNATYEFTIPLTVDGKQIAIATAKFTKEELDKMEKRSTRRNGNK